MKKIAILGSTGSVGTQALSVIKNNPKKFKVSALSANKSVNKLLEQIIEFKPKIVALMDEKAAKKLKKELKFIALKFKKPKLVSGLKGLIEAAIFEENNIVLTAFSGAIGIKPTIEAIKAKKTIALANKETMVAAGSIVSKEARKNNVNILPVDSEHSAIFQCLMGEKQNSVKNIILTCSGGPFRTTPGKEMQNITLKQALKHPSWNMGAKITIDSSTLMNKGLEIIEAKWLFNLNYSDINVVIHPQSLVHSLVEFKDNSIKAQIGSPTMLVPIQLAFTYPERIKSKIIPKFKLMDLNKMTFEEPDYKRFPALNLAFEAGRFGGTMPTVLNSANEAAVERFLNKKIGYLEIVKIVRKAMEKHNNIKNPSLDDILEVDREIREKI